MKNNIHNTQADMQGNAARQLGFVCDALAAGTSGAIEAQEAAGARQFQESDVLPVEVRGMSAEEADKALAALGFTLGGRVQGDDLFRYATLPKGWAKKETGHSMWTEIVDETGRTRIRVFYKAAFYDRRAFASIVPEEPAP